MPHWMFGTCPICGLKYSYTVNFKPNTCSKIECVNAYYVFQGGQNGASGEAHKSILSGVTSTRLTPTVQIGGLTKG